MTKPGIRPPLLLVAPLLWAFLFNGCTQQSDLPLEEVEGRIVRNGQPLEGVIVQFKPREGRTSFGRSSREGFYRLHFTNEWPGAMTGEHTVTLVAPMVSPAQIEGYATMTQEARDNALRLQSFEVPQRIKVVPGQVNVFNFDVAELEVEETPPRGR